MKKLAIWILTALLALLPVCALADGIVTYTADFYVADYAGVIGDEVEGLIVLNNDLLDKACGAQIVVVTVDTVGSQTLENYAYTLFNEWGIGAEGKNNGLLILLAIDDGGYWIMPGKGLQDYLTAGDLDEMAGEYLIPYALEGNYEEGVRQLFGACFEKVSLAYSAGLTLDDTLYFDWLQTGSSGADGAKYLNGAVRELQATAEPVAEVTEEPVVQQEEPVREPAKGGFGFMHVIIILIVLLVIFGGIGAMRSRPGRRRAAPPPPPPRPMPPRPPMGGYGGYTRPAPRPPVSTRPMGGMPPMGGRPPVSPRPPMGNSRPAGNPRPMGPSRPMGGSRPMGASRPMNSRPMGGSANRGGVGGSFGGSRGGRSGGGFGGGRSGGGGMTRGGGSGGSFGGRR